MHWVVVSVYGVSVSEQSGSLTGSGPDLPRPASQVSVLYPAVYTFGGKGEIVRGRMDFSSTYTQLIYI